MAANEDNQRLLAMQITDNKQLSTPPAQNEPTVKIEEGLMDKFRNGEEINLLSDDEGNDDLAGAFATQGAPPFRPQAKKEPTKDHQPAGPVSQGESNMQEKDHDSTAPTPLIDADKLRKMALERQRQFANKYREKQAAQGTAPKSNTIADDGDDAYQPFPHSDSHSNIDKQARGKDAGALRFEKIKAQYLKKKRANTLDIDDEIAFIQEESKESARLRKVEADEAYEREEAPSPEKDEGLFMSEPDQDADVFRAYESEEPKKRGRKRPSTEDSDDEQPEKRKKPKTGSRKGKKAKGTGNTDQDDADVSVLFQSQVASKVGKNTKAKRNGKKGPISNMANLHNMMGTDVFADTARTAHLPDQPTFEKKGPRGQRGNALKQLLASVPIGDKKEAGDDKRLLNKCIQSFTGSGSGSIGPAYDGNWRLNGFKSTLKHYQVLGTGFMRDRENATSKPKGGILADMMGLGKTIMMLANIVNGRQTKEKQPRTTLIVASPAILTQWFQEISKHCYIDNTHKHGLGSVLQWRAGHKPISSNLAQMFQANDIVLTTYHEVATSFPKAEPPAEIVDAAEKEAWRKMNFEENKGPMHSVKFHRVVLDEAHAIKNYKSHTSRACRALQATHYWAITGTPVMNTPLEFYPYFDLIREPAAGDYELFKTNFGDTPKGHERLNVLLQKTMCRRKHFDRMFGAKLLDLPMPKESTHWVQFNEIERKVYKIVETRFIERINKISQDGELDKKYKHIWTMLLRLRQLCSHILLIQGTILDLLEREDFEELNRLTENEDSLGMEGASLLVSLRKVFATHHNAKVAGDHDLGQNVIETETRSIDLVEDFGEIEGEYGKKHGLSYRFRKYLHTLRKSNQWEALIERSVCCACRQKPLDPHITSCFHIYCRICLKDIQEYYARKGRDCAECTECGQQYTRAEECIGMEDFQTRESTVGTPDIGEVKIPKKAKKTAGEVESWVDMDGEVLPSAKTIAIKAQVIEWFNEDPKTKIIIYTQFLPMIKILAKVCGSERWGYLTYSGEMSYDARDNAIQAFRTDESKNILLASLRSGGLGLNLTAASRVINIDPWWNSALEQQAFCRVFRIGQDKPTRMTRLVVKGTVDARMQEIKSTKQIEIDNILSTHQKQEKLDVQDLLRLFGDVDEDDDTPFIHPKSDSRFDLDE